MLNSKKYLVFITIVLSLYFIPQALAVEIRVQGEGSVGITQNVAEVQYKAQQEATRKALVMAFQRILEPDCFKDPRVKEKFNDVFSQLSVYKIKQTYNARRESNVYVVTTELIIDETKLRQLLSDMGIALRTSIARSSAILTIMDEFFTKPSDLDIPSKESVVYKYDRDSKYKEEEKQSGKESEAMAVSNKDQRATSISARDQSSGSFSGKEQASGSLSAKQVASASGYGKVKDDYGKKSIGGTATYKDSADAKYAGKSSVDAKYSQKNSLDLKDDTKSSQAAAYARKSDHNYGHFIDASENEHEYFEKIKEYQHLTNPDKNNNFAIKSLQSAFQMYDLRILDNDLFRSKYFGDKVITINQLNNSSDLANYVKFARKDARADFFAIGNSAVIDRGKDKNTDLFTCDGAVTIKVYSTLDAETIASGVITESAAGNSPDQCRAKVADKVGEELGKIISNKIQEYWKKRQMYGSEYVVTLIGSFPARTIAQFTNSVKQVQGVTNVKRRKVEDREVEFIISYNGGDPLADSIFAYLALSPLASAFSNYAYSEDGNQIRLHPVNEKGIIKK